MNQNLKLILWNLLSMTSFFSGGNVRTKSENYMEYGKVTSIKWGGTEYVVIEIEEWLECRISSSLAVWGTGKHASNRLYVRLEDLSIVLRKTGACRHLVIEFTVPGLGQCELHHQSTERWQKPRLGTSDFVA